MNKQMPVNQLSEPEADNLLNRQIFVQVPTRVEYQLAKQGKSLMPVIKRMG